MHSTGRKLWQWTQIGMRAPTRGPNGGLADTLDAAKAAFRRQAKIEAAEFFVRA
jgi:hypothetical protein